MKPFLLQRLGVIALGNTHKACFMLHCPLPSEEILLCNLLQRHIISGHCIALLSHLLYSSSKREPELTLNDEPLD